LLSANNGTSDVAACILLRVKLWWAIDAATDDGAFEHWKGIGRMARKGIIAAVLVSLALLVGCTGEDGAAKGVTDGVAAAVSSLIKAPVEAWIAATFP
jgi:hypothetical protein